MRKKVLIRESFNFDTRVKSQVPCYMHFPFVSLRFMVGVFLEINFGGLRGWGGVGNVKFGLGRK